MHDEQGSSTLLGGISKLSSVGGMQQAAAPNPSDRLISAVAATVSDTSQQQQQYMQLLAGITLQLAELEAPKRGLTLSNDEPLLRFYKQSLQAAVEEKGPDAHVLVLSNGGGGVLAMLAAAAGAGSVMVVEKGRWGFRAAQQLLEANRQQQPGLVSKVQLVPVPLSKCLYKGSADSSEASGSTGEAAAAAAAAAVADSRAQRSTTSSSSSSSTADCDAVVHVVSLEQQQPEQGALAGVESAGGASAGASGCFLLDHQADIVVTDLLDYRCAAAVAPSTGTHLHHIPSEHDFAQLGTAAWDMSCNRAISITSVAATCPTRLTYARTNSFMTVPYAAACSVLGQGLLPILQAAAANGLISRRGPAALAVPGSIAVQGQLVNTALTPRVSGFDLAPINRHKWHPTIERIEHDRCGDTVYVYNSWFAQ
jgi:hypothetical protein